VRHTRRDRMASCKRYWCVRATLVTIASIAGAGIWTGIASGAQPYETYENTVRAADPVAYFPFNDAVGSSEIKDIIGSYTGENVGVTLGEPGPFGGSKAGWITTYYSSNHVKLPAYPLAGAKEFSAEAWVYWKKEPLYGEAIFAFGSSFGGGNQNYMYLSPGASSSGHKMTFEIHVPGGTKAVVTASKPTQSSWHYMAVTETSSGTLTLYLDGEKVGQSTGATLTPASLEGTSEYALGEAPNEIRQPLDGSLSNVAFYTKALSATTIHEHYDAAEYPVNTEASAINGTAQQGKTLTTKTGTWTGLKPITFAYQWERCTNSSECVAIPSATESKYVPINGDVGRLLRVAVTGTNSAGASSAQSAQTAPVKGIKPSNISQPMISGSAEDGELLSVSSGSWEGTTPISYAYEWQRCNATGGSCKQIPGANASSYRLTSSLEGRTLRAIVVAANSAGSGKATSAVTATITAGLPVNTALPAIFGTAEARQALNASAGAWVGSEPFSYTYQWQRCNNRGEACSSIVGATSSTYSLSSSDVGTTLRMIVTVTNPVGSETATSLPSPVVAATPPENTQSPTMTGTVEEGQTLTASAGSWTGVEPVTYSYQWQRCSTQALGMDGSANGEFMQPGGVAVDSSGDLWVADTGNDRVEEFNGQGEYLRQFGSPGSGNGQLSEPSALAFTAEGDLWVADTGNDRVEEFSPSGEYITQIDPQESEPGELQEPEGIAVDRDGDIWVSDTYKGTLVEFNAQDQYVRTVGSEGSGSGQLGEPEGIVVDSQGHVWVADWSNDRVEEFSEQGVYLQELGAEGAGPGQLKHPFGVAVGLNGDVWVGDVGNDRVEEFGDQGEYVGQFGAPGSAPGQIELFYPMGLALLPSGELWLTDTANSRLERFNGRGEYLGDHCASIPGATSTTYSPTAADVGSMLRTVVTATDAEGSATAISSPSAVVAPAPPVNTHPPVIEGVAKEGQTLTASTGSWSGASLTFTYQWKSCNSVGEACTSIEGANNSVYVVGGGEVGSTLRVLVSVANVAGEASAVSSPTAVVAQGPPVNTHAPVIEGVAKEGQTLTANIGSWRGTTPLGYSYQWESCDAFSEACIAISGATSSTYLLGPSDLATTLEVTVTATNVAGVVSASSPRTLVVGADRLENTALPAITGTAQEDQTLTASAGSWTGVEPVTYSYQWQRCHPGLIGSKGSANGELMQPGGVAVDSSGDLWVADTGDNRVEEFNGQGEYLRQFGSPGSGNGQLSKPSALAFTAEGDLWVADTGNDRVEEFSPSGEYITQIDPQESEPGELEEPEGIAVDRDGDVWVSDTARGQLVEFNEQEEYVKTVGSQGSAPGQLGEPEGIAVDSQGHVWVADSADDRIVAFNEQGEYLQEFGSEGSSAGQLEDPFGITVTANGDIWVGDVGNNRIEEFNEHGGYIRQFATRGSAPGQLELYFPMGLVALSNGELWFTDTTNDRLERLDEQGEYLGGQCLTIPGATAATYSPTGADVGSTLQVIVTATNAEGEVAATTLPTAIVSSGASS
jgi:sugar lactone lactonase YvrE